MKTLVYSSHEFEKPFLQKAAKGKQKLEYQANALNIATAEKSKGFDAIALFTADDASSEVLKVLHQNGIKYIALRSVGYDHVDLKQAKALGIKVANVPSYSPYSIAEYAVTLLLALNRKIMHGQALMQHNNFCLDSLIGFDLHGKTIGIIGTGKIGAAFARIMHGFGCTLLGYDIEPNTDLEQNTGIRYTTLEDLCSKADVISIHCPLNEATKYLFDKDTFGIMKKGVYFINTARGGIVNTLDLIEALDNGTIAAAGLDVYEYEKPIFFVNHDDKPIQDDLFIKLRAHPNVLITGHQAFLTRDALSDIASATIQNLEDYAQNGYSSNDLV